MEKMQVVCLILALLASLIGAAEIFDVKDINLLVASPDAVTSFVFPRFPERQFPSGEPVEILTGFYNKGKEIFNITKIAASFNYPLDYSYYIQNFTTKEYGLAVAPGDEISVSYVFKPDPLLEPREFGLVVSVFYQDSQKTNWTSVAFNSTVDMVESGGGVDAQTFFTYLGIIAFLGLSGFLLSGVLSSWVKKHKRKGGRYEVGTKAPREVQNEWLIGTSAEHDIRKKKKTQ